MLDIIYLFATLGISILISKKDGPFNMIAKFRDMLFSNKYIGVFSYNLINCLYCSSFWVGFLLISFLQGISVFSIVFAFACSFMGYIVSVVFEN